MSNEVQACPSHGNEEDGDERSVTHITDVDQVEYGGDEDSSSSLPARTGRVPTSHGETKEEGSIFPQEGDDTQYNNSRPFVDDLNVAVSTDDDAETTGSEDDILDIVQAKQQLLEAEDSERRIAQRETSTEESNYGEEMTAMNRTPLTTGNQGIYQEKLALSRRGGFGESPADHRVGDVDTPSTDPSTVTRTQLNSLHSVTTGDENTSCHLVASPDVVGGVQEDGAASVSVPTRFKTAQTMETTASDSGQQRPLSPEGQDTLVESVELVEATPVVLGRRRRRRRQPGNVDDEDAIVVEPMVSVVPARADHSRPWRILTILVTTAVTASIILGVMLPRRSVATDPLIITTIGPTLSPTGPSQPSGVPSLAPSVSIMPSWNPTVVSSQSPSFGPRLAIESGVELRAAIRSCTLLIFYCRPWYARFALASFRSLTQSST